MKRIVYMLICFVFLVPCFAAGHEKSKLIKNIRGEYTVISDSHISMQEAKEKAREDAKRKALIEAFGEQISISDKIEISSAGESFNSMAILQNNGEIESFQIKDEGFGQNPNRDSELVFYCVADVKVKRGVSPDPNFTAAITGINVHYRDGEYCQMKITPTQNAFLKIFIFENSEIGYYLYPGGKHHGLLLEADKTTTIPNNSDTLLQLFTDKPKETNTFVILLTKQEYPFNIINPTRGDIDRFIARIPNNVKYVSYHMIDIMHK